VLQLIEGEDSGCRGRNDEAAKISPCRKTGAVAQKSARGRAARGSGPVGFMGNAEIARLRTSRAIATAGQTGSRSRYSPRALGIVEAFCRIRPIRWTRRKSWSRRWKTADGLADPGRDTHRAADRRYARCDPDVPIRAARHALAKRCAAVRGPVGSFATEVRDHWGMAPGCSGGSRSRQLVQPSECVVVSYRTTRADGVPGPAPVPFRRSTRFHAVLLTHRAGRRSDRNRLRRQIGRVTHPGVRTPELPGSGRIAPVGSIEPSARTWTPSWSCCSAPLTTMEEYVSLPWGHCHMEARRRWCARGQNACRSSDCRSARSRCQKSRVSCSASQGEPAPRRPILPCWCANLRVVDLPPRRRDVELHAGALQRTNSVHQQGCARLEKVHVVHVVRLDRTVTGTRRWESAPSVGRRAWNRPLCPRSRSSGTGPVAGGLYHDASSCHAPGRRG